MIEADIQVAPNESSGNHHGSITKSYAKAKAREKGQLVDFDHFLAAYWPHFSQSLKKNFRSWTSSSMFSMLVSTWISDPLLIFNEIIGLTLYHFWWRVLTYPPGIISGSERAIISPGGYLDRQAYLNLSPRSYPTFADHRDAVYDLFLVYLKRKMELDDTDVANRLVSYVFNSTVWLNCICKNPCHHTLSSK